ncbi:permease-like cell division protein FtsX [Marinicrinis lubricantis]|uniref:Cell division protein FtsX n=1 Tax=Marinicrinis lubricantis TaxID=2086470 RepID=A0ABW1IT50_9BACL
MKISTIRRHVREGSKSVFRNGWMSFASTSAIAISLFILGVFSLLALNVDHLAGEFEEQVEIRVYLDVIVDDEQLKSIQNEIGAIGGVNEIRFVSKEEGLESLKEKLGEVVEGYEGDKNPLPDSFVVRADEPRNVANVAAQIEKINEGKNPPPIIDINYGKGTVETLFKVTNTIRNIGLVLVALLAFTAMFLIANTIKITIMSRRREISIMKLVGATNGFIRWPFFIEGALLGLIGSVIPMAILMFGYWELVDATRLDLALMDMSLLPMSDVIYSVGGSLVVIGILLGVFGSTLSIRKFLKV